jgi:hypothetical protein
MENKDMIINELKADINEKNQALKENKNKILNEYNNNTNNYVKKLEKENRQYKKFLNSAECRNSVQQKLIDDIE